MFEKKNEQGNVLISGNWGDQYDCLTSVCLKSLKDIKSQLVEIIIKPTFKLFLFSEGSLYAWGMSKHGCLGLGIDKLSTWIDEILKIDVENVVDVKAGKNHVLA